MQDFLNQIIREAGAIGKEYFARGVTRTIKSLPHDFVTEADVAVNEFLVNVINTKYPTHRIKSEEMEEVNATGDGEYEWVIDPIDGTYCFANGIPYWAVMIAIMKKGEPYLAAVYFPVTEQLFIAEKGHGAFLNGKQIHVSNTDAIDFSHGLVYRCVPGGPYGEYFERFRVAIANISLRTDASMVNFASAASWCYIATGAMDFALANGGLDWDRLPVDLIMREAGAIVTDSDGNPWQRGRQDCVAANPNLHAKVMELFLSYKNIEPGTV